MSKHSPTGCIDVFFLLRPVVLIPVWGFALFGYFRGLNGDIRNLSAFWKTASGFDFLWMVIFSISVGSVYVLNQIADIDTDRKNPGLALIAGGIVSVRTAWIVAAASGLVSILIPALFHQGVIAWLSLTALVIGLLYSFKPTFFSGRPVLDFLANATGFAIIAFGCGWSLAGRNVFDPALPGAALPYFFLMCAGSISSTIPDVPGDRASGKITTAVALGDKKAHLVALVFVMAASLASIVTQDWIAAGCALFAMPFYLLYAIQPRKAFAEATYKAGGALCMIAAGCIEPVFILCAAAVFGATWMYFRIRHGVSYPSLVPANRPSPQSGKAASS